MLLLAEFSVARNSKMSHVKKFIAIVSLTITYLLLYHYITFNDLDIAYGLRPIEEILAMGSPMDNDDSINGELRDKYENLHILLTEIAVELDDVRKRLIFSKHGKDLRAKISKGTIRKVSAQSEERYFELVKTYNNSELIQVRAHLSKLPGIINGKYFRSGGNNCQEMKERAIGKAYPMSRLNHTCTESMDSLLENVGLHPNLLSLGMPRNKVLNSKEGYLLTYLHIFKNAVISPDGDVYFEDIRVVPWRCITEPSLSWSQLQKRQVYDEVLVKILDCNKNFFLSG